MNMMQALPLRAEPEPNPISPAAPDQPIWDEVTATALRAATMEPLLRPVLERLVLKRNSLADAVAEVLATRLCCEDLRCEILHQTLHAVFIEEPLAVHCMATDLQATRCRDPASLGYLHTLLNMKGFQALQLYRVAHVLWRRGRRELAALLANRASQAFGTDIHPAARIGAGVLLDHGSGIVIGETAVIDDNVSILQNVTLGGTGKERGDRHPKVRSGVMIGAGASVLGNIVIGAMSKIAAGSVVLEPVPEHCTVAGVPARIVRRSHADVPPAFEMNQSVVGS